MNSDRGTVTQTARVLAVVRLVFGTLQVIGATMGLVFLLETGVSVLTVATVAITAVIYITSRILFSKRSALKRQDRPPTD
jgi:hypothetical protein